MPKKKQGIDNIGDVAAIGVFVNHQIILKVFPDLPFESRFKHAYKDFKQECLSFLKQVEEKDDLEVRHFDIDDSGSFTMFYSEVGDKEAVFLMSGDLENGFPSVDTLHVTVRDIIASLFGDNNDVNDNNYFSSIEEVFRTMDLDGNGTIDEAEFNTGLGVLGVEWKDSKIKKLFNQIDEEGNGEIPLDSFMRFRW
eukprot:36734_1